MAPVVAAALTIPTRVGETGTVCLTTVVHARETVVDAPAVHDHVAIPRMPMPCVVEGPVPVRKDNGTTLLAVVEEVLVVAKRWRLREESTSARNAARHTSKNGSHYAVKRYRWSVYLKLTKIHKGEVVWPRHW
jgi:hypothetical protein